MQHDTGVCERKHPSGKEDAREDKLSDHQIGGWRAVSGAGLQGKVLCERSAFSQTPASYETHHDVTGLGKYKRHSIA